MSRTRTHMTRKPVNKLQVEALEDRRLLAGSISIEGNNVAIDGSLDQADICVVRSFVRNGENCIDVSLHNATQPPLRRAFVMQKDNGIVFRGYGGQSWFFNYTNYKSTATGGPERDLFYGGGNEDIFHGFEGNDELWGYSGSDDLRGGGGHDNLYGGDGVDELFGGEGDDELYGHGDIDFLFGGKDEDTLDGGLGDDYLDAGSDIVYERVYGGHGADKFYEYTSIGPEDYADWQPSDSIISVSASKELPGGGNTEMPQFSGGAGAADFLESVGLRGDVTEWTGAAPHMLVDLVIDQVTLFEQEILGPDALEVLLLQPELMFQPEAVIPEGLLHLEELSINAGPQDPTDELNGLMVTDLPAFAELVEGMTLEDLTEAVLAPISVFSAQVSQPSVASLKFLWSF